MGIACSWTTNGVEIPRVSNYDKCDNWVVPSNGLSAKKSVVNQALKDIKL